MAVSRFFKLIALSTIIALVAIGLTAQLSGPHKAESAIHPLSPIKFRQIANSGFGDPGNSIAWSMAWFKGKLYVGTGRHNLCLFIRGRGTDVPPNLPVECPEDLLDLDLRAQIWRYTPETGVWEHVFTSPRVDFPLPDGTVIEDVPRDAGYRGMIVYTDKHGVEALYVGTAGGRATILRTTDGTTFEEIPAPAADLVGVETFRDFAVYNGRLYTSPTFIFTPLEPAARVVFESDDPASGNWRAVSEPGFGDLTNGTIYEMESFAGFLYVGTANPTSGFQIWKTNASGTPPYEWTPVITNGAERGRLNGTALSMEVFQGRLYVGTAGAGQAPSATSFMMSELMPDLAEAASHVDSNGGSDRATGASELIRINPDDSWEIVVGWARHTADGIKLPISGRIPGFGNVFSAHFWNMEVYEGWLYLGTIDGSVYLLGTADRIVNAEGGFDLWATPDGRQWLRVTADGLGNPLNQGARTLVSTPVGLFLGTSNPFTDAPPGLGGAEVWLGTKRESPLPFGPQEPPLPAFPIPNINPTLPLPTFGPLPFTPGNALPNGLNLPQIIDNQTWRESDWLP